MLKQTTDWAVYGISRSRIWTSRRTIENHYNINNLLKDRAKLMSQSINQLKLPNTSGLFISRFLLSILPALLLIACSSDVMTNGDPIPPDLQMMEDMAPPEDTARLLLLRNVRWPGGGREMTVGILNQATGLAFQQDLSSRLLVQPPDGIAISTKVQKIALAAGYTAVLLPPSQTAT